MRTINEQENKVLCMFEDEENFIESYNLNDDPYQLYNIQFDDVKDDKKQRQWMESSVKQIRNFKEGSKINFHETD